MAGIKDGDSTIMVTIVTSCNDISGRQLHSSANGRNTCVMQLNGLMHA